MLVSPTTPTLPVLKCLKMLDKRNRFNYRSEACFKGQETFPQRLGKTYFPCCKSSDGTA